MNKFQRKYIYHAGTDLFSILVRREGLEPPHLSHIRRLPSPFGYRRVVVPPLGFEPSPKRLKVSCANR